MWDQYKKTFLGVQVMAVAIALWVYFGMTHWWASAALVFLTMELGGLAGAAWANRIRKRVQQAQRIALSR
jgi:hypothetical protein